MKNILLILTVMVTLSYADYTPTQLDKNLQEQCKYNLGSKHGIHSEVSSTILLSYVEMSKYTLKNMVKGELATKETKDEIVKNVCKLALTVNVDNTKIGFHERFQAYLLLYLVNPFRRPKDMKQ